MAETWERVLTQLEADVADLESQLSGIPVLDERATATGQPGTWAPPSGLGPLPPHLADRARQLAAAQAQLADRLEEARTTTGQHLAALRTIPAAPASTPVYLDVEG